MTRTPVGPRLRHTARAIILDEHDRVLLCRFRPPHPAVPTDAAGVWAAPGGGVEAGELTLEALHRELLEETGLVVDVDPPHVWRQELAMPGLEGEYDGLVNDYFLVRTPHFEPRGSFSDEQLAAELIGELRWWRLTDIAGYDGRDVFSPRDLATPLAALVAGDVPSTPVTLEL